MTGKVVDFVAHRFGAAAPALDDASFQIERNLLAALLRNPSALEVLPEGFGPHLFHYQDHDAVFEAIKEAAATGATYLVPLVRHRLPHLEDAGARGGVTGSYIVALAGAVMAADKGNVRAYAEQLQHAAMRRALADLGAALNKQAAATGEDAVPVATILAQASVEFDRLCSGQKRGRQAVMLADAVEEAIAAGEVAAERGGGLAGISCGFRRVDERLGGFEPATLNILAARPAMGKTALGLQMALKVAHREGPVLFVSLEMAARQLGRRALALASGVPGEALKSGSFTQDERMKAAVIEGRRKLYDLPLSIEDEPNLTVDAIRHRIKAAQHRMGELAMVVVDHLHIVGRPETAAKHGDTHAITEVSRGSKRLAKEFDVPVLLLAQLSRGVEGRDDKRPNLSDLRQSGAIEEDADAVMMLYRAEYYARKAPTERRPGDTDEKYYERMLAQKAIAESVAGKAELLFEKVRDGKTGVEELRFDGDRLRFSEEALA